MSLILTGETQKLSFSILRKVPFLIFWSDKPPRRTNSAHAACSRAGTWAAWADFVRRRGVSCIDKIYIFEILMKNFSKYSSPSQIRWNFFKSGHPYPMSINPILPTAAPWCWRWYDTKLWRERWDDASYLRNWDWGIYGLSKEADLLWWKGHGSRTHFLTTSKTTPDFLGDHQGQIGKK